jgi:hypothetical protein
MKEKLALSTNSLYFGCERIMTQLGGLFFVDCKNCHVIFLKTDEEIPKYRISFFFFWVGPTSRQNLTLNC